MFYIGIDIGGTWTKGGIVCADKILFKYQTRTQKGDSELLETVFKVIDNLLKECRLDISKFSGIGVGICGMVLANKGLLLYATNLEIEKLNLVNILQDKYGIPVRIGNDVAMYALAESHMGNIDNLVYLALGTGVNVGVISEGKLFCGANGASIEYGHTSLLDKTISDILSGTALSAGVSIEEFLFALNLVVVNIVNTYRPEKIYIGGGVASIVEPHIESINKKLKDAHYGYKNAPPVEVLISQMAIEGAILGATLLFKGENG